MAGSVVKDTSPSTLMLASCRAAATARAAPTASFMGLPTEVRLHVYHYMFKDIIVDVDIDDVNDLAKWVRSIDLRFCDVFKSIYLEAVKAAFESASFRIVNSHRCSLAQKGPYGQSAEEAAWFGFLFNSIRTIQVDLEWFQDVVYWAPGWTFRLPFPRSLRQVVVDKPPGPIDSLAKIKKRKDAGFWLIVPAQELREMGYSIRFAKDSFSNVELEILAKCISDQGTFFVLLPSQLE
ncbi:hypothetical protein MMC13_002305 [Lambiella insularis]|nr:hypothetical protein [Lambiella insularis]